MTAIVSAGQASENLHLAALAPRGRNFLAGGFSTKMPWNINKRKRDAARLLADFNNNNVKHQINSVRLKSLSHDLSEARDKKNEIEVAIIGIKSYIETNDMRLSFARNSIKSSSDYISSNLDRLNSLHDNYVDECKILDNLKIARKQAIKEADNEIKVAIQVGNNSLSSIIHNWDRMMDMSQENISGQKKTISLIKNFMVDNRDEIKKEIKLILSEKKNIKEFRKKEKEGNEELRILSDSLNDTTKLYEEISHHLTNFKF